jgi:CHASE3 domain sensor protein
MRVVPRIIAGYAFLAVTLSAVLVVCLISVQRLESLNRDLASNSFQGAMATLQLIRSLDTVAGNARAYLIAGESSGPGGLRAAMQDFEASLWRVRTLSRTMQEEVEVERLEQFWKDFHSKFERLSQEESREAEAALSNSLEEHCERLRTQAVTVFEANRNAAQFSADSAADKARRASLVCWAAGALSLALSGIGAFVVARTIAVPLRNLMEGMRALVEGKTFYRLDTSRTDELALISRDVNILSGRMSKDGPAEPDIEQRGL